jgi:hypothetical protein
MTLNSILSIAVIFIEKTSHIKSMKNDSFIKLNSKKSFMTNSTTLCQKMNLSSENASTLSFQQFMIQSTSSTVHRFCWGYRTTILPCARALKAYRNTTMNYHA